MSRKIVQIEINSTKNFTDTDGNDVLEYLSVFALCDDGTVWESEITGSDCVYQAWKPLPQIPQPEEKEA